MESRIFSILCQNAPGVMMRITRVFMRRQINIDSITVGIEPSGLARIILMFKADDKHTELLRRILLKLEPIESVESIRAEESVVREVALIKTKPLAPEKHWQVVEQIERAGGKIIDSKEGALIAEISGEHEHIERLLKSLGSDVLREVARSGQVYISREL